MSDMTPIQTNSAAYDLANRRWGDLKTARAQHENLWRQLAQMFRPHLGGFGFDDPAARQIEKPVSSAGIFAAEAFASGLYGAMTNPANRWFGLQSNDDDLNAWQPAKLWQDMVTTRILQSFGPSISPYYSTAMQTFTAMAILGNAAEYDQLDAANGKIMDVSVGLGEIVVDIDFYGQVVEIVRRFYLTPMQAVRQFGRSCPPKLVELSQKSSTEKFAFYHHVMMNDEWSPGKKLGAKGKPWLSVYTTEVDRTMLRMAGYDEMPFYFARWAVDSGQTYGLGAGYVALPSAKEHQLMSDATLRFAQNTADPVLLAPDREVLPLNGRFRPGSMVYGATDMQGRALVRPLERGGNIGLTLQDRNAKLEEIKDAFHFSLLQLAGRTGMTATEVMAITEERQRLWAPHQGRIQQEYLARKIERRFAMLWRAGQLPPPPKGMPEGATLEVKYMSAASAAQQSTEANGLLRLVEDTRALAAVDPASAQRVSDRFNPDGFIDTLIQARGAPARAFRSREEADQISTARAEQQQQMQAMQMAQAGAGAMKDAASAAGAMPPEMLEMMGAQ